MNYVYYKYVDFDIYNIKQLPQLSRVGHVTAHFTSLKDKMEKLCNFCIRYANIKNDPVHSFNMYLIDIKL